MNIYIKYLLYVLEHKKNVFIECINMSKKLKKKKDKLNIIIHGITHDMSKFSPCEFIPYARFFYGDYIPGAALDVPCAPYNKDKILTKGKVKYYFNKAWKHHYSHNKHHYEYWDEGYIPSKYIIQMICDWNAMSRKFGDTTISYYLRHYNSIKMHSESRRELEKRLGIISTNSNFDNFIFNYVFNKENKQYGYYIDISLITLKDTIGFLVSSESTYNESNDLLRNKIIPYVYSEYNFNILDILK